jgi:hypothetical protein
MHWGCGPRPLLRDWFREDGPTMNISYTILFLIPSQTNNYKSLGRNSIDYLMLADK